MKQGLFMGATLATILASGAAQAQTLQDVQERGVLICGADSGLAGFAAPDSSGVWQGFDVSLCRAIAAAVLSDPTAVTFVPLAASSRFSALASGEVDILARSTAWTFTRDVGLPVIFAGVSYYDGQGFMVPRSLGVTSARDLDGATVCIQIGTNAELTVADYFRANNITYELVPVETNAEAQQQYLAGACDVFTADVSALAATRARFANPEEHVVLREVISREPLGPVVRHDDQRWADLVRWTLFALIAAEEHGVTSANIAELAGGTGNPEVNRLLGADGNLGHLLGLDSEWALRAISAGGNYGEIFAATIGEGTPIGLARGLNALWTQGGLMYAPPFR